VIYIYIYIYIPIYIIYVYIYIYYILSHATMRTSAIYRSAQALHPLTLRGLRESFGFAEATEVQAQARGEWRSAAFFPGKNGGFSPGKMVGLKV
jgi:hypothetical protein